MKKKIFNSIYGMIAKKKPEYPKIRREIADDVDENGFHDTHEYRYFRSIDGTRYYRIERWRVGTQSALKSAGNWEECKR